MATTQRSPATIKPAATESAGPPQTDAKYAKCED